MMAVTDAQLADVVERLCHDLRASGCDSYSHFVEYEAANARGLVQDPDRYVEKVVEDVQQRLHDEFINTVWPQCPRHLNHPLWYHEGAWICEQDRVAVAALGSLSPPQREASA